MALAGLGDAHDADRAFTRNPSELRIALTKPGDAHDADRAFTRNPSGQPDPHTKPEEAHPADRAPTRNPSGPSATHGTCSRTRMTPVHRITHSPTAAEVELADGTTERADAVIVTPPIGALSHIEFDPPLPAGQ